MALRKNPQKRLIVHASKLKKFIPSVMVMAIDAKYSSADESETEKNHTTQCNKSPKLTRKDDILIREIQQVNRQLNLMTAKMEEIVYNTLSK